MSEKSSKQLVLDAIIDLHNQEQLVTREALCDVLNLKKSIIDDRLTCLINEELVYRAHRGVYVPRSQHKPARLISKTLIPDDGTVKIDIGDDVVLTLTPREARILGGMLVGEAMQYSNIELGHHNASVTASLELQMKELQKTVREITTTKN